MATTISSPQTTPLSASTAAPTPPSRLSSGTNAGVGVGIAVGALAIAGLAIFVWMRRRKTPRKSADMHTTLHDDSHKGVPSNYVSTAIEGFKRELPGEPSERHELASAPASTRQMPEMQG